MLKTKVDEVENLRAGLESEYEQLKKINSGASLLDEWTLPHEKLSAEIEPINFNDDLGDLSLVANPNCDYKRLVEECFNSDADSEEIYLDCSQKVGCSVGATRRPMYDKMSFRRK